MGDVEGRGWPRHVMHDDEPIVFVVDDDVSFRQSTERLLRVAGLQVYGFSSAAEFLAADRADVTSCLVLDARMPGSSGLDLQRRLAGQGVETIFMTGHGETKPFTDRALLDAVAAALERSRKARRGRAEAAEILARQEKLTPREGEVMRLVVRGMLNKQIAGELGISEITVKLHRQKVMVKMGAPSLAALVRMCERLDLLNEMFVGDSKG